MTMRLVVFLLIACTATGRAAGDGSSAGQPVAEPQRTTLVYGADSTFPPLSFRERGSGSPTGFEVELVREIGKVMGFDVEVRLDRWSVVRAQFEAGEIDVVGMYEDPSRHGFAVFGDPYATGHSEIYVRRGGPTFESVESLDGRRVAIEASALASDAVKQLRPGVTWVEVASGADVVRAVASGEADAGIAAQFVGRWAMKEYGLDTITTSGPPILKTDIALCVRPDQGETLRRLNEGLRILKANGTYSALYDRWLTPHKDAAFELATLVRWAVSLAIPLLAAVVAVVVWNRALAARVAARTQALRVQLEETRRAEGLLAQSRARAASLFEYAPEAILVVRGSDGTVLEANPHAARLFATSLERLVGRGLSSFMAAPPDESSVATRTLLSAGVDRPSRVSTEAVGGAGGRVHCEWWSVQLPGDGERTLRVSVIDVSDLVEAERHREALERELDHARQFEAMGRLAGGVVHDVNNLLTTVVGCVRLIGPEIPSGSRGHRTLATLESAADQGAGLTRRLLDYVRGSPSEPKTVNLGTVVDEAIPFLREVVADAKIVVHWSPPEASLWVVADPVQLRQILFNLADNAREAFLAAPSPAPDRVLRLSARGEKGQALLTVEDTGPGMSPEHLARCFEPFFSTRNEFGGSGLGLSTCRDLASRMGGTLAASSQVGRGTRFELMVPLVSPPDEKSGAPREPSSPARERVELSGSVRTILVVEDNQPVREVLMALLARAGRRVVGAGGASEAYGLATLLGAGDLVICDVNLLGDVQDSGASSRLLAFLRSRVPGLRLVVMSGSAEGLAEVGAEVEGVDATLLKPFAPEALESLVGQLLEAGAGSPR